MNINCIICSDLFLPTSEIYTTKCGHLFHFVCLMTWLERSRTCPQCRHKTTEQLIHRIYFNFSNVEVSGENIASLQNKADSLILNLRMKENELKAIDEKYNSVKTENMILENKFTNMQSELVQNKSAIGALKEQLIHAKERVKEREKIEIDLQDAKEKLRKLEFIKNGITGSMEEAQEVARNCQDVKTLSVIMTTLKKEIQILERKKEKMFTLMKRAEKDLHSSQKESLHYQEEIKRLNAELKGHQNCDNERKVLKQKIEEITKERLNSSTIDPTIRRVLQESPAPLLTRPKVKQLLENTSFEILDSPDVQSRVKAIKESDSPYLQVKSNGMGLLFNSQKNSTRFGGSTSTSIFKMKRNESQTKAKSIPEDITYDGLGGHGRFDKFPISIPKSPVVQGVKRSKSSSTITSSKFRKLTKPQSNKLDDYLKTSDLD